MNTAAVLLCAAAVLSFTACRKDKKAPVEITGTVTEINSYGQIIPSFTPLEMMKAGFGYADLIEVTIGDKVHLVDVPFVTSFNEVAILGPSYVDYNAKGDDYGFAMLNGDFHRYIGGELGDAVTMRLTAKGGYSKTYELMKSIYALNQLEGESDEQYANFRMVTTSNIASGVLYRSGNPLNCVKNPERYKVVDKLAEAAGIKTEIDLADKPEEVEKYMASDNYAATYCPQLFKNGSTMACGMMADSFCEDFKTRLGSAVKFMLNHEPPYLIHCNEGKDRCGFVSMVFEALCGADIEELRRDYMVTMLNYYKIPDGGESYRLRQRLSIDRMVWLMCNEESLEDYQSIDWDGLELYFTNLPDGTLQSGAKKYLGECGLSDSEIESLRLRLTTGE